MTAARQLMTYEDLVALPELYARHAVSFYWLIDPVACNLEALVLDERGRWVVAGTYDRTAVARVPPFEAIELAVGELFMPEREGEGPEASRG